MGQDPGEIREQIEQTRERMSENVDALSYKANVPARAKESITKKARGVKAKITGTSSQISDATPDAQQVKQAGRQTVGIVEENPLGLVIGAAEVKETAQNTTHQHAEELKSRAHEGVQQVTDSAPR